MDRRYLMMIADLYGGGPVGIETLAAGLSEPRDTLEDVVEPYLIQLGLIARTARGRCLNGRGWTHLGLTPPSGAQTGLFDQRRQMMLLTAALLAAAQAGRRPGRSRLFQAGQLAVPAGPHRHLLNPAQDHRAQPQWLWLDRPVAGREECRRSTAFTSIRPSAATAASTATSSPATARRRRRSPAQFARFAGTCRTFAPIYRSMTVGLITAVAAGADFKAADGHRLWRRPRRLEGISGEAQQGPAVRPVGHSQGSWMLQMLIANEIEGKPVARQMEVFRSVTGTLG